MKKFYSFLVAAVLLMGATSCQKEATESGFEGENMEFTASIASGRTELGDGNKVMWNSGDNIRIYTQKNWAGNKFSGDAETATATAKFTTTENFTASNNGYLAVYPETANTANATFADGVWSIPVNMTGWDGNPANYPFAFKKNAFMAAFSTNNQLAFKAATAMLKIKNVDNSNGGEIRFSGANLGGAATLHYDTNNAENPISYTLGSGDSNVLYNFTEGDGATIYVPIYPGTVTGFEVYGDDWENPLVTYNKEITFKAGVIYDLDLENAGIGGGEVTSPYAIKDWDTYGMTTTVQMVIENGYHVAKNVPFSESGYAVFSGWDSICAVGAVALNTWVEAGLTAPITFEADYVDIYLTEDASLMCIVPAGTPFENLPALPTYDPSPYSLYSMSTETTYPMIIKDGLHVAKNVPATDAGDYVVMDASYKMYSATVDWADVDTWYPMVSDEDPTIKPLGLYMSADVYVTADLKYITAVYEGYSLPELPAEPTTTTYLKPNADWITAGAWFAAYYYNNDSDYVWVKAVDTDSDGTYECSVNGTYTNVTFCRMNPGFDTMEWGTSEENRVWNKVEGLTIPTTEENCCYVTDWNAGEWNVLNYTLTVKENCLYLLPSSNWKEANARFAAYFFNGSVNTWVDMNRVGYEGYYEVEIPSGYTSVIFCRFDPASTTNGWTSSMWGQTADLTIPTNGNNLYTVVGWAEAGSAWSTLE